MSIIATIFAYGLLFLVAMLAVFFLLTVVCYYLSSKILKSLNDSWGSAFRMLGYSILIGIGFSIIGTIVSSILPKGTLTTVGSILVLIGYLYVLIKAANKIYDLGNMKSALLLLLSGVMYGVILGAFFLAIFLIAPKHTATTSQPAASSNGANTEATTSATTATTNTVKKCQLPSDCADNENCISSGICVTDEVLNKDYPQGDCETMACANCYSTHMTRAYSIMKMGGTNINYCMECNPLGTKDELCGTGYECYLGKCIQSDPANPKGVVNCATLSCEGCANNVKEAVVKYVNNSEGQSVCRDCSDNKACKAGYECKDEACVSTAKTLPKLPKLPSSN